MGPSKLRRAIGAVKDRTSIGIAKVSNSSTLSDLYVAIVKATRHDEHPADDKYISEILSLTCYSRAYVSTCVSALSRRLGKTRSWAVALKTLIVIHRLLSEGDPSYEQEIFFATRCGTRMLNMSDFRDTSRSDAWDFSAFVRTYALYLDERLEFRMHGRRKRQDSRGNIYEPEEEEEEEQQQEQEEAAAAASSPKAATPARDMNTDRLFALIQHLQQLLERFLACKPTGAAKEHRIVAVALYPVVKESFQIYYDMAEMIVIFVERFMELKVLECVRVHEIFSRLSKQFDELDIFYAWSKSTSVCRSSEFPDIDHITPEKLQVMDEFIRDKSNPITYRRPEAHPEPEPVPEPEYDMNHIKALPAPEKAAPAAAESRENERAIVEVKNNNPELDKKTKKDEEEVDFLNLKENRLTVEEHGNMLALALFDGPVAEAAAPPKWEAFGSGNSMDWETALVQTASSLSVQKASLGGGLDMMLLDGMYSQAQTAAAGQTSYGVYYGSSSSVVVHAPRQKPLLALPAPPLGGGATGGGGGALVDPFAASLLIPPPAYVQMSVMERKQQLLTEEQLLWQRYAQDGMQGQLALSKLHQHYVPGGYARRY